MKISTKGRYGLEALVEMTLRKEQGPVSLKSIAEQCGLSEAYMLQIFLVLRRAGIVQSVRGPQGGYILAKNPDQIRTDEVLEILEGPMAPVACIVKDCPNPCDRFKVCATRILWERINTELNLIAASVTLETLAEAFGAAVAHQDGTWDYCI